MADTKISELSALDSSTIADGDLIPVVDISDTTMASSGTNKKITKAELAELFEPAGAVATHTADTTAAHAASAISYAGGTGMSATDVEAAIDELATEKADLNPAPVVVSGTTDTLSVGDNGKTNRYTNASLVTVTLPTDVVEDLPDGFWCGLYAEGAAGLTLSTSGLTLTGSSPNKTIAQNEMMVVIKTASANTWMIIGGTAA